MMTRRTLAPLVSLFLVACSAGPDPRTDSLTFKPPVAASVAADPAQDAGTDADPATDAQVTPDSQPALGQAMDGGLTGDAAGDAADAMVVGDASPDADGGPKTFDYDFTMPYMDTWPGGGGGAYSRFTYVGACGGNVTVNFYVSAFQDAGPAATGTGPQSAPINVVGFAQLPNLQVSCVGGSIVVTGVATGGSYVPAPDGGAPLNCSCQ